VGFVAGAGAGASLGTAFWACAGAIASTLVATAVKNTPPLSKATPPIYLRNNVIVKWMRRNPDLRRMLLQEHDLSWERARLGTISLRLRKRRYGNSLRLQ
jgi:hypothetical protein